MKSCVLLVLLLCPVARDLLAAGRVQFKNCVLLVTEPQKQSSTDIITPSDTLSDTEEPALTDDTIQVSYVMGLLMFDETFINCFL